MIKKHHGPHHFGKHDTLKSLRNHGYNWRAMESQVKNFTESCELCQMVKARTHRGHNGTYSIKSDKPGERISLDVMEYNEDVFNFSFIVLCKYYDRIVQMHATIVLCNCDAINLMQL